MIFPQSMYPYTLVLAPLVSIALVLVAALLANRILFPSILGNALIKVIVHAPIFFALKMAYLMYRVWPAYLKQTTTPSVSDFVVRRAPDVAALVAVSEVFLFILALLATAIAYRDHSRNVWVTAILFALAYSALIYGASTNSIVAALVDVYF
jgi:hypothetical protein